jgi:hypothetical protein
MVINPTLSLGLSVALPYIWSVTNPVLFRVGLA